MGENTMPRGKKDPTIVEYGGSPSIGCRKNDKKDEWAGFIQVSIKDSERQEFDLWVSENGPRTWRELDDALGVGLKLTVAFDGGNDCYIASLTGRPDIVGSVAWVCCLSGRGGTLEEAVNVVIYKHVALLNRDWYEIANNPKAGRPTFG
jgi:hypothetical protein